jgi:hypothetical protein
MDHCKLKIKINLKEDCNNINNNNNNNFKVTFILNEKKFFGTLTSSSGVPWNVISEICIILICCSQWSNMESQNITKNMSGKKINLETVYGKLAENYL